MNCKQRQTEAMSLQILVIHILRYHQGGGGVRNDYVNVIFALSSAEFDYGRRDYVI